MNNNRPHWADTAIAIFTGLMLITYITGNYFSCQQLRLTRATLKEVQTGGTDTHNLATAAKTQADAAMKQVEEMKRTGADTHELASAAKRQAENTERLAIAASRQAVDTHTAADAAAKSAEVAATQFEFVERPKISTGSIKFTRPATITPQGGMTIDVMFTVKNSGQTQAVRTFIESEMFPITWEQNMPIVYQTREQVCKSAIELSKTSQATFPTVYAGKEMQWGIGQRIQPKVIEQLIKKGEGIVPAFIICIAYHPTFKQADYFTAFVFEVTRRDKTRPHDRLVFKPEYGTIPLENLDAGEPEISPE